MQYFTIIYIYILKSINISCLPSFTSTNIHIYYIYAIYTLCVVCMYVSMKMMQINTDTHIN